MTTQLEQATTQLNELRSIFDRMAEDAHREWSPPKFSQRFFDDPAAAKRNILPTVARQPMPPTSSRKATQIQSLPS